MSVLVEKLVPEAPAADDGGFGLLQRKAQKVLMQHGFPHRKTENWKYTPLSLLEKRVFDGVASPDDSSAPDEPTLPFEAVVVHLHNGELDPARCDLPRGMTLTGLVPSDVDVSALDENGPGDAFAWLNLARLQQGWRLRIDKPIDLPLVVAQTFDDAFSGAVHPRIRLELAPDSSLTLVEWQQPGGPGLANTVLDIALEPRARLNHVIERSGGETAFIQSTTVAVDQDANYRAFVSDGGGRLTRQELTVSLNAANASTDVSGVATLADRSLVDYHTAIEHRVGPSHSRETFRILADDQAVGVFNGRILIVRGADDSHSDMNTGNLLLSENARINIKPELEIHAEEVTAAHGATVGQLDELARFYLRSRGLDDSQAIALLKYGFAAAVFDEMDPGPVRDWVIDRLKERQ